MKTEWLSLLVAATLLPATVGAQDDFFTIEGVEEEEVVETLYNEIELGAGYLDENAFRFGKFSGLTDDGLQPLLDFRISLFPAWDGEDTGWFRIEGRRLGLDTRRLEFAGGRQGSYQLRFGYREMHNNVLGGGQTPFLGVGTASLTLPTDWTTTGTSTANMPALEDSLRPVDVGHRRRRVTLGYTAMLATRWTIDADYRRETKDGTRIVGAAFGFNGGNPRAANVPAPVDFATDLFDVKIEFDGGRYQAGFAYHGSLFGNREDSLTWRNPFGQLAQWAPGVGHPSGVGRMALEPSNQFHQFRVFGGTGFGATTRVTADFAVGRMTQDEAFLPYTINPLLVVTEPLPRTSLDGRIDTTVANLRLTSQPLPRLSINAGYRFDDRDNRTPQDLYRYIAGDSQNQRAAASGRINLPYSYREHRIDLSGTYRLAGRTRLTGGYQYRDADRDFSESAGFTEKTVRVGLRTQPSHTVSLSLDVRHAERDAHPYDGTLPLVESHLAGTVGPDDFENHPLLRKYYLSDRDRDRAMVRADWMPVGAFSLGLAASYASDDYEDGFFGLNDGSARSVTVDGGYHPSAESSVFAWFTRDKLDARQTGRAFGPGQENDATRDWAARHDDRIDTIGVNLQRTLGQVLELGSDAVFSRSRTTIDVTGGSSVNTLPFPILYTKLNAYTLYLRYHRNAASSVRVGIEHERFDARDFAFDGIGPATLANVLWLAPGSPDYKVNWLTASYRYRF